jgi:hypothetical protein
MEETSNYIVRAEEYNPCLYCRYRVPTGSYVGCSLVTNHTPLDAKCKEA